MLFIESDSFNVETRLYNDLMNLNFAVWIYSSWTKGSFRSWTRDYK